MAVLWKAEMDIEPPNNRGAAGDGGALWMAADLEWARDKQEIAGCTPASGSFLPDINALPYFFLMLAHIRKELILLLRMFQKSWHGPTHRILLAALQRTLLSLL